MTKRLLIFLILLLPLFIAAQEIDSTSVSATASTGFGFGGAFGSMTMNGKTYAQIRLMPELVFGKFGIGLDADILIDEEGNIREEDWDEWEDYVNKVYYIRYGQRGDKFYGRIGGFKSYTLGHGLIMSNYTNMLLYPEYRQIGLQLGGTYPGELFELEVFTSNVLENDILAGRVAVKPLSKMPLPILNNLKIGVSAVTDRDQYKGLLDDDDDNYANEFDDFPYDEDKHNLVDEPDEVAYQMEIYQEIHGDTLGFHQWFWDDSQAIESRRNRSLDDFEEDDVTVFGLDYELPLIELPKFYLSNYGEYAQIVDHEWGFIFPGFYMKFLIFNMNLEYRYYHEDFEPSFFDNLYDENRVSVYTIQDTVNGATEVTAVTKEETLSRNPEMQGWYGSITANLFNTIYLTVAYEDMYTDVKDEDADNWNTHNKSIWGKLSLAQTVIPQLKELSVAYQQTRVEEVLKEWKTPSTLITGTAVYGMAANTNLVVKYQERYVDYDGNGEIKGEDETIKTMAFGVEFRF